MVRARYVRRCGMVRGHSHIDRCGTGNMDRCKMAESFFMDPHASHYRHHARLPECLVLGDAGGKDYRTGQRDTD